MCGFASLSTLEEFQAGEVAGCLIFAAGSNDSYDNCSHEILFGRSWGRDTHVVQERYFVVVQENDHAHGRMGFLWIKIREGGF